MQAAIRTTDRAIVEVSPPGGSLGPRDGCEIVTFTAWQQAHWQALSLPPGEVMALGEDGSLFVLEYGQAPPTPDDMRAALTALVGHPDPAIQDMLRRLGVLGGDV